MSSTTPEKMAPVQGYIAGIPWAMHLRAYDAYCKRYGSQPALIQGGCRGGFGDTELDLFIPGWREELSELLYLRRKVAALSDAAKDFVDKVDRGEARSVRSYAAFKAALELPNA